MGSLVIGFDLDGVMFNHAKFKVGVLKELHGIELEEWKLSSNVIDEYLSDKNIRHEIGALAGTTERSELIFDNTKDILQKLKDQGFILYLVSRRGKSELGTINAKKSIENLGLDKFFDDIFYCQREIDKINKIYELGVDVFIDDRIETIDELSHNIKYPILFDNYKIIENGYVKTQSKCDIAQSFSEILTLVEKYEDLEFRNKINECIENVESISLETKTGNVVYRVANESGKVFYAKFYKCDGVKHKDNELMIYSLNLSSQKYFKNVVMQGRLNNVDFAIFEEVKGELLSSVVQNNNTPDEVFSRVAYTFDEITRDLFQVKTIGFGKLNGELTAPYDNFLDFIKDYVVPTQNTLKSNLETSKYADIIDKILDKYPHIFDNVPAGLVPMDNNFNNIIIDGEKVIFIDPGAVISAPIYMGYGEFTAHSFSTKIYDEFKALKKFTLDEEIKVRAFACFSLLNVMAFLVRIGKSNFNQMTPFGNTSSFNTLLELHLKFLNIE
ncbi:MAG: hypothetical protein IJX17_04425 [Clostridia bacterium]|nr:hypothetical protein [Clostridia bacterium]